MAQWKEVRALQVVPAELSRPLKASSPARRALGRTELLEKALAQLGTERSGFAPGDVMKVRHEGSLQANPHPNWFGLVTVLLFLRFSCLSLIVFFLHLLVLVLSLAPPLFNFCFCSFFFWLFTPTFPLLFSLVQVSIVHSVCVGAFFLFISLSVGHFPFRTACHSLVLRGL